MTISQHLKPHIKFLLICCAIAALLSLTGVTSVAQQTPSSSIPADTDAQFRMMDSDGDGKVSSTEHALGGKRMFAAMDTNKDDQVTVAEMDAAQPAASRKAPGLSSVDKINVVDTNKDGLLTGDEHTAASKRMFSELDLDSDGGLTAAEIRAGHVKYQIGQK